MSTPMESRRRKVERPRQMDDRERHFLKYLREVDREVLDHLDRRYGHLVPRERIETMRKLPTRFESRREFDHYLESKNIRTTPEDKIVGIANGTSESAHVAIDHLQIPKTIYHERLHQLANPQAKAIFGRRLTEGITEEMAVASMGVEPLADMEQSYLLERRQARKLRQVCGKDALDNAYFRGEFKDLVTRLEAHEGPGALRRWRIELDREHS